MELMDWVLSQDPNECTDVIHSDQFVTTIVDSLVDGKQWMLMVTYLQNAIRYYVEGSVVQTPVGAPVNELVRIHGELFLAPHHQCIYELLSVENKVAAQEHFKTYLAPIREAIVDGRVRNLITEVGHMIQG
ncbi:hypothetical protein E2562_027409 [Oryza meyeriana var. granulata]|uniref:Uncharacterized protein n=1 Tax=Oryza meyeriana var. granulata TaxID=110450 RepID=A0A6G1EQA5_9ORYZ|nr:hypothetical protein E2562_027409 [Oryza meyeriana var. granulata]